MRPTFRRSCSRRPEGAIPTKPECGMQQSSGSLCSPLSTRLEVWLRRSLPAGGIPAEYPEDAPHIAVAAVNGIEVVITWNFAHLNNPFTRMMVRRIVEAVGYECPEICSPEELLEVDK